MRILRHKTQLRLHVLVIGLLLMTGSAQARDYLIEIVLFESVEGRDLTAGGLYYPKLRRSIRLGTEEATAAGFVPVETGLTLTGNAASIASSRRYRLIRHLAWRQPGLDENKSIPVRISLGDTMSLYLPESIAEYDEFIPASIDATAERPRQLSTSTLNGSIKVHLGRFLHMEALLVYTDAQTQQSFRLSQSRKMRSRELHYIDNPRFGLLTRILPIEDPEGSGNGDETGTEGLDDPSADTLPPGEAGAEEGEEPVQTAQ